MSIVVGKNVLYHDPGNNGMTIPALVMADHDTWDGAWYANVSNGDRPDIGTYLIACSFGGNTLQYATSVQEGNDVGNIEAIA